MGLWWTALSFLIAMTLCFVLWYFVPNGALFFLGCVPFFYHRASNGKWQYLFMVVGFLSIATIWFAIPYFGEIATAGSNLWHLYQNIYPNGFMFSWIEYVPAFFWTALAWTVSLLLFCKFGLWIAEQWTKKQDRYSLMVFFSHCFAIVFIIYILISLIPSLCFNVDMLAWFRSNAYVALAYDILFIWLPFICTLFIVEFSLFKLGRYFKW
jgi:hypothetical protein